MSGLVNFLELNDIMKREMQDKKELTTFYHGNFFVVCFCCELVFSSFREEVGLLVEMVVYQICFMNGVAINRTIK